MRREKRRWIYAGLGVPAGVALVRPASRPVAPRPRRVLLVGGDVARAIAAPLGRLAADSKVGFRVYTYRRAAPRNAALDLDWLIGEVRSYKPSIVMLALEPPPGGPVEIDKRVRSAGAAPFWLARKGKISSGLSAEALHLSVGKDRMSPTASGYAAWAAAVWRMVAV